MHAWGDRAAKFKRSTLAGRVPLTKRIRTAGPGGGRVGILLRAARILTRASGRSAGPHARRPHARGPYGPVYPPPPRVVTLGGIRAACYDRPISPITHTHAYARCLSGHSETKRHVDRPIRRIARVAHGSPRLLKNSPHRVRAHGGLPRSLVLSLSVSVSLFHPLLRFLSGLPLSLRPVITVAHDCARCRCSQHGRRKARYVSRVSCRRISAQVLSSSH